MSLCQAAVQVATTLARSVPIVQDLVASCGTQARCQSVRSVDVLAMALEQSPQTAGFRLLREIDGLVDAGFATSKPGSDNHPRLKE